MVSMDNKRSLWRACLVLATYNRSLPIRLSVSELFISDASDIVTYSPSPEVKGKLSVVEYGSIVSNSMGGSAEDGS